MVDFKGAHFPKSVLLHAVFFCVRYPVSYRDLQEILAERGISIDHATLNRWVIRYSPQIAAQTQLRKRPTSRSWRVDETYIKVKGKWTYLYRTVDRLAKSLISFCLNVGIWLQHGVSSRKPLQLTVLQRGMSLTKTGPIWPDCKPSTRS